MAFDLRSAITTLAPTLATMLGGPLAGAAVTALEGAFGLAPGSGQDGITKVLQTGQLTSDQIAAVRAADQKHAEIIQQQGIDLIKLNADHEVAMAGIDASDRASARQRENTVQDQTPKILAATIVVAWCFIQWHLINNSVPVDMREIIERVLGTLDAALMLCLTYYFGSNASSKVKDQTIATIAKG